MWRERRIKERKTQGRTRCEKSRVREPQESLCICRKIPIESCNCGQSLRPSIDPSTIPGHNGRRCSSFDLLLSIVTVSGPKSHFAALLRTHVEFFENFNEHLCKSILDLVHTYGQTMKAWYCPWYKDNIYNFFSPENFALSPFYSTFYHGEERSFIFEH